MIALIALMPPYNRWFLDGWFRPAVDHFLRESGPRAPKIIFLSSVRGEEIAPVPADDGYTGPRATSLLDYPTWSSPKFKSPPLDVDHDHDDEASIALGSDFVPTRRDRAESCTEEWVRRAFLPEHHGKILIRRVTHDRHEPNLEDAHDCLHHLRDTTPIRRGVVWDVSRGVFDHHAFDRARDMVEAQSEFAVVPIHTG